MAGILGETLPWPRPRKREQAATSETTGETTKGGSESTTWVVVAENLNPGEAAIIKGRLESEDIPAVVQQEAMGSVLGLTVGPLGSAKVLVPEPLAERALSILAETFDVDWDDESDTGDEFGDGDQ